MLYDTNVSGYIARVEAVNPESAVAQLSWLLRGTGEEAIEARKQEEVTITKEYGIVPGNFTLVDGKVEFLPVARG